METFKRCFHFGKGEILIDSSGKESVEKDIKDHFFQRKCSFYEVVAVKTFFWPKMFRTKKVFKERQYSERDIGEMGEYGTTAKCTTEYMKNQQKIVVVFSTFFCLENFFLQWFHWK